MECIVDTHILGDILCQFNAAKPNQTLQESRFITRNIAKVLNQCVESEGYSGVVVSSTFAFIEILNKFEEISESRFGIERIIAILNQPPDWFIIEPFSLETNRKLILVPKTNLAGESIELADAIHVATALQRGPSSFLATHDQTLRKLNFDLLELKHIV